MESDVTGRMLLDAKPRITEATIDRDYLKSLPKDTFGRAYFE